MFFKDNTFFIKRIFLKKGTIWRCSWWNQNMCFAQQVQTLLEERDEVAHKRL